MKAKLGKENIRGKLVEGQWVFGGCEKDDSQNCFIVPVEKRDKGTLLTLIQNWVRPGSIVMSDCWKAYCDIPKLPENYKHFIVNHSQQFKSSEGTCTNTTEGTWRHMKRSLPLSVRKSQGYDTYLAEYMWRRHHTDSDLFTSFMIDISKVFKPNHED